MRVLCLTSFPVEAAATRFRVAQFIKPLAERGINLEISSFFDSKQFAQFYSTSSLKIPFQLIKPLAKRVKEIFEAQSYDLLFVQREAMFFGPEIFERLIAAAGRLPLVLDLDDATYTKYVSPRFGRLTTIFKFFGKTDRLIRKAEYVICGNRFIAEYVTAKGAKAEIVPTVVDTEIFRPSEKQNKPLVIGWIGTHSTYPSLQKLFPVLSKLALKHNFRLRIVGAGCDNIQIPGVEVENLRWSLEREVSDFSSLDIGLYPIFPTSNASQDWIQGKSGFKAVQYMACGVPFVMSPVGVTAEMGKQGETHFNAESDEDWYNSLDLLLSDSKLRQRMGEKGRLYALQHYTIEKQVEILERVFRASANKVTSTAKVRSF
jgi:glycosyltransferase involved in cell wall biosynthesis